MSTPAVQAPLAQLPNALTVARLALIPLFIALVVAADGGPTWAAGTVFLVAGITDQIDGFLARRWRVESSFGKVADPLADRLMIDAAVILLFAYDRFPWAGLAVILARDLFLIVGYKLLAPRGYELDVNLLGKAGTWILYLAVGCRVVTHTPTMWPIYLFWSGLALALVATGMYVAKARQEVGP